MALKKLRELDDTDFENLVFDLMTAQGMLNVTWRTPGADGGRDIEGTVVHSDFSLTRTEQKWYVECRRGIRGQLTGPPSTQKSRLHIQTPLMCS